MELSSSYPAVNSKVPSVEKARATTAFLWKSFICPRIFFDSASQINISTTFYSPFDDIDPVAIICSFG